MGDGENPNMRKPRKSKIIAEAEALIAALRPIESTLDFGKSLTFQAYIAKTDEARGLLANLNTLIAQMDAARNVFGQTERDLMIMTGRIRKGVLVQFGEDSVEYQMAGGTRTSERKRTPRRPEASVPDPSNQPPPPTA
jgi:hypothetical protein